MNKLPKEFLLGGSISGPQTEGWTNKKNDNIFDYWYKNEPSDFFNSIGPDVTSNMFNTYKEDIKLFKKVGLKIFRTTVQWSRLFKNIETWEVDEENVEFYRDYFSELKKADIKVVLNLFHFDIPYFWHQKGGWENKIFTDAFAKYAEICFNTFGDLIDSWATMNEPIVVSESFYAHDFWWPKLNNFKKGIQVSYNEILASAKAIKKFKTIFKDDSKKEISIILNLTPAIPKDNEIENVYAAKMKDLFSNRFFLDASIKGEIPSLLIEKLTEMECMFEYTTEELDLIKNNTIDFLGVNYYAPCRVEAPKKENLNNKDMSRFFEQYFWPEAKMNIYRGWEIFPNSISDICKIIKDEYNNIKWFMSENGMGVQDEERFLVDGVVHDDYRIDFIKEHLNFLSKGISEGANCFAYCIWAPIDCWSWANSYKNRYGLIRVDLKDQKRTIKKSGEYFKKVSDTKEI
ncbi:glycoside hydrolase family 1 protein [Mesoplasma florum]|uniref:glycoside hydrolase family 1 protein n=1 Tax=Mesoplasma florum TaxID=2151 RepID=UPI000D0252EB|nr:glycoside hydrolase family 1 protein [Mesoplasma florum]AVN58928.1 6-phospho-beta-glucosidase [Mesoplasma florum]